LCPMPDFHRSIFARAIGAPKLRGVLANPGKQEETDAFVLDQDFWCGTQ
jgi:hypothetical protein